MEISVQPFGKIDDRVPIDLFTLKNNRNFEVKITNYGGTVVSIAVPDRNGAPADVVLGYDALDEYLRGTYYFGCIVGRYANRIANGSFTLNNKKYHLAQNESDNHLHGGARGFDKVCWDAQTYKSKTIVGLELYYRSTDGEEGYPGNLAVTVKYTVTEANELRIDYQAVTDKPTLANLTNHTYFNLSGKPTGDILGHKLMLKANAFTPVDATLIPTGELRSVTGTPMDFTQPVLIGARINEADNQFALGKGYDHNWVLDKDANAFELAARAKDPESGRAMDVYTTEPGIQFYSGNFLDNQIAGKAGAIYGHRSGFCLETQHFPDSPNKPEFPSTVLMPGSKYTQTTVYKFFVDQS
jgi:aldose 1-epimerase